jgi:hypothetical protein
MTNKIHLHLKEWRVQKKGEKKFKLVLFSLRSCNSPTHHIYIHETKVETLDGLCFVQNNEYLMQGFKIEDVIFVVSFLLGWLFIFIVLTVVQSYHHMHAQTVNWTGSYRNENVNKTWVPNSFTSHEAISWHERCVSHWYLNIFLQIQYLGESLLNQTMNWEEVTVFCR